MAYLRTMQSDSARYDTFTTAWYAAREDMPYTSKNNKARTDDYAP